MDFIMYGPTFIKKNNLTTRSHINLLSKNENNKLYSKRMKMPQENKRFESLSPHSHSSPHIVDNI